MAKDKRIPPPLHILPSGCPYSCVGQQGKNQVPIYRLPLVSPRAEKRRRGGSTLPILRLSGPGFRLLKRHAGEQRRPARKPGAWDCGLDGNWADWDRLCAVHVCNQFLALVVVTTYHSRTRLTVRSWDRSSTGEQTWAGSVTKACSDTGMSYQLVSINFRGNR
jgi:hypothetical protein